MAIVLREGNKAPKEIEGKEEILPKGISTPKVQEPVENKIVDKPQEISYNNSNKESGYVGFSDTKPKSQNSKSLNGMPFSEVNKNNSFFENRYKFGPQFNEWVKKNHDAIKYSGDNTFNNIKNTMEKDVPRFMKDAPFNVDQNGLISSLVKWNLADKIGNKDLKDKAVKNTIGYMSEENQEEYLKDQQPLEDYVKASDDYDHQRGDFKTIEYSTSEPDEDVMKIQNLLVDLGYTNMYGEPINVDGLSGSNTLYAADTLTHEYSKPASVPVAQTVDENEKPQRDYAKATSVSRGGYSRERYYANDATSVNSNKPEKTNKTSDGGVLSPGDEEKSEPMQTMLKCLSSNWFKNDGNAENQGKIETQAINLRKFDDESFNRAIFMNKSDGVRVFGHSAIMLINNAGKALVFSIYSDEEGSAINNAAEMRFSVLTPKQAKRVLEEDGYVFSMPSSDGEIETEYYDRFASFEIDAENGFKMYEYAVNLYDDPGKYKLFSRQCDDIACEILSKGGIDIKSKLWPNLTYNSIDKNHKSKNRRD